VISPKNNKLFIAWDLENKYCGGIYSQGLFLVFIYFPFCPRASVRAAVTTLRFIFHSRCIALELEGRARDTVAIAFAYANSPRARFPFRSPVGNHPMPASFASIHSDLEFRDQFEIFGFFFEVISVGDDCFRDVLD